ncbi:MAG: DUF1634 domain-containing protein [Gammaproteobacteria bacterium]|nr:DUF1634 domain-containing protein [Gammaproteobacteria bacterium]
MSNEISNKLTNERQFLTRLILRTSIGLCLLLIVIGLAIFFARGGTHVPLNPSGKFSAIVERTLHNGAGLHASAFLIAGIVVLLLTPIARLLSGVVMSARAHDWLYLMIGLIVLALLIAGLLIGQATA